VTFIVVCAIRLSVKETPNRDAYIEWHHTKRLLTFSSHFPKAGWQTREATVNLHLS
jgi:hypothetical protein